MSEKFIPTPRNTVKVSFTDDINKNNMTGESTTENEVQFHPPLQHQIDHLNGTSVSKHKIAFENENKKTQKQAIDHSVFKKPSNFAAPFADQSVCIVCRDNTKTTSRCASCKSAIYCSSKCQTIHWTYHRKVCSKLKEIGDLWRHREDEKNIKLLTNVALKNANIDAKLPFGTNNKSNMISTPSIPWLNLSGKTGLNNIGNSCYLNSALQCLSHIIPLTSYFVSNKYIPHINTKNLDGTKGELSNAYSSLLKDVWFSSNSFNKLQQIVDYSSTHEDGSDEEGSTLSNISKSLNSLISSFSHSNASKISTANNNEMNSNRYDARKLYKTSSQSAISPVEFKKVLGSINEDYLGFVQQDTHDVLETILDRLHEDVNRVNIPKPYVENKEGDGSNDISDAIESLRRHRLRNNSIVDDILGGQLRSQLTCSVCHRKSVNFDFTRSMSLAIPRSSTRLIRVTFTNNDISTFNNAYVNPRPRIYTFRVERNATIGTLKQMLCKTINATDNLPTNSNVKHEKQILRELTLNTHPNANKTPIVVDEILLMELFCETDLNDSGTTCYSLKKNLDEGTLSAIDNSFENEKKKQKKKSDGKAQCQYANTTRMHMNTISAVYNNNDVPLSSLRYENREFIAFRRTETREETNKDLLVCLQRSITSKDASYMQSAKEENGSKPNHHVHFEELSSSFIATDLEAANVAVRLVGLPFVLNIDMKWSCAKVRYIIWQQIRRYCLDTIIKAMERTQTHAKSTALNDEELNSEMQEKQQVLELQKILKDIKKQVIFANLLPIRLVNQYGHAVRSEYDAHDVGGVPVVYSNKDTERIWTNLCEVDKDSRMKSIFDAILSNQYSDNKLIESSSNGLIDRHADVLGSLLPINNNISIGDYLSIQTSKTIPFLAVDYMQELGFDGTKEISDMLLTWLPCIAMHEVESVDAVISSTDVVAKGHAVHDDDEWYTTTDDNEAHRKTGTCHKSEIDPMENFVNGVSVEETQTNGTRPLEKSERRARSDSVNCNISTYNVKIPLVTENIQHLNCERDVDRNDPHNGISKVIFARDLNFTTLPALPCSSVVTLEECMKHYTAREILDKDNAWYCSTCKAHQPAEKSVGLWKLPSVLVITLKRFEYHTSSVMSYTGQNMSFNQKIDTFIDFPVNGFDAKPFLSRNRRSRCRTFSNMSVSDIIGHSKYTVDHVNEPQENPSAPDGQTDPENQETNISDSTIYDLFAVCNHIGRSGYGHYTAMARDWRFPKPTCKDEVENEPDAAFGPWYQYDDDNVELIRPDNDMGNNANKNTITDQQKVDDYIKTNQAYILFYRLRS